MISIAVFTVLVIAIGAAIRGAWATVSIFTGLAGLVLGNLSVWLGLAGIALTVIGWVLRLSHASR